MFVVNGQAGAGANLISLGRNPKLECVSMLPVPNQELQGLADAVTFGGGATRMLASSAASSAVAAANANAAAAMATAMATAAAAAASNPGNAQGNYLLLDVNAYQQMLQEAWRWQTMPMMPVSHSSQCEVPVDCEHCAMEELNDLTVSLGIEDLTVGLELQALLEGAHTQGATAAAVQPQADDATSSTPNAAAAAAAADAHTKTAPSVRAGHDFQGGDQGGLGGLDGPCQFHDNFNFGNGLKDFNLGIELQNIFKNTAPPADAAAAKDAAAEDTAAKDAGTAATPGAVPLNTPAPQSTLAAATAAGTDSHRGSRKGRREDAPCMETACPGGGKAKKPSRSTRLRGPKHHPADAVLLGLFSKEQLRATKAEWMQLLAKASHTLCPDQVTRLKQLRRRSKCCLYSDTYRQQRERATERATCSRAA